MACKVIEREKTIGDGVESKNQPVQQSVFLSTAGIVIELDAGNDDIRSHCRQINIDENFKSGEACFVHDSFGRRSVLKEVIFVSERDARLNLAKLGRCSILKRIDIFMPEKAIERR